MVLAEGLEPPRLTALVPKTSVSTNSTTRALGVLMFYEIVRRLSSGFAAAGPARGFGRIGDAVQLAF